MSWTSIAIGVLLVFFVVVCLLMITVILMQRSKNEGLGAAFGGGMTDTVFGARTSEVLIKVTIWLASFYFILTIGLAYLYAHRSHTVSPITKALTEVEQAAEQAATEKPLDPAATPPATSPTATEQAPPAPTGEAAPVPPADAPQPAPAQ